ncbi:hypothetical protein ACFL5O_03075 [Myxococcota bacterium]
MLKSMCVYLVTACLLGCASTSTPPADPSDAEEGFAEPEATGSEQDEPAPPEYDDVEQSESGQSMAAESDDGSAATQPSPDDDAKPTCGGLDQDRCKITTGCAWSSAKTCINE